MEILGEKAEQGFSINELMEAKERAEGDGFDCEYFNLKRLGLSEDKERYERADEAGVLIIRDVLGKFGATKKGLKNEMKSFECDKQYFDTRRQKGNKMLGIMCLHIKVKRQILRTKRNDNRY